MRRMFTLFTLALAIVIPAGADDLCTTSRPEVDTGRDLHDLGGPRYYVDNDPCWQCMWSIWVYQESNGIEGLQRGDEVVDNTDGGRCYARDTIIL